MTDVLSQDEIDNLLQAISSGEADLDDYSAVGEQKKVKIYDFRRPDKFAKDQIRTLQMMHETFARLTTTVLSSHLRDVVSVHVGSVDQLTYEEFIRSIPNPSTLAVVNMDPLRGSAVLEIDPAITYAIIDRLFGGPGEPIKISRDLTDIELSVMEGIIVRMLGNLRESWSTVIDLRPRLGNIETNPQFAQIVPPNDMTILVTLEVRIGDVEGMMNFCIPYIVMQPILKKLKNAYWYGFVESESDSINIDESPVKLGLSEFDDIYLTKKDIENLKVGDEILLGKKFEEIKMRQLNVKSDSVNYIYHLQNEKVDDYI